MEKKRTTVSIMTRLMWVAALLLLAGLACSLPTVVDSNSIDTWEYNLALTEEALEETQAVFAYTQTVYAEMMAATQTAAQTAADTPFPPENVIMERDRIPGLDSEAVLVWWLSDGDLNYEFPDGALMPLDVNLPINPNGGLPASTGQLLFGYDGVFVVEDGEANQVVKHGVFGSIETIPGVLNEGTLTEAALSPNGSQLLWLYDVTEVQPEPMGRGCEASWGCVGRLYKLMLSDVYGQNSRLLAELTENSTNFPYLQIAGWRDDMGAVFLKRNAHIPSALYPDEGGDILEVNATDGTTTERQHGYAGSSTYISPQGSWLVSINDADKGVRLGMTSLGGQTLELPIEGNDYRLAFQVTFSPDGRWLVWLDVIYPAGDVPDWENIQSIEVRGLDLAGSTDPLLLATYEPPFYTDDLPYTGQWLNDELLTISKHHDTQIVNVNQQIWVDFEWAKLFETGILAGVIYQ